MQSISLLIYGNKHLLRLKMNLYELAIDLSFIHNPFVEIIIRALAVYFFIIFATLCASIKAKSSFGLSFMLVVIK